MIVVNIIAIVLLHVGVCCDRIATAAVGCTLRTAFTQSDADRFTALSQLTPAVPELLEPLPASRNAPGPLGPISHNILPSQHPSTGLPASTERNPNVCFEKRSCKSSVFLAKFAKAVCIQLTAPVCT